MRGSNEPEAEAAGTIVAQTILMWRKVLLTKFNG